MKTEYKINKIMKTLIDFITSVIYDKNMTNILSHSK